MVNVTGLTSDLDHKMSLELRVKEKLLRYPEEMFFDSQGIPIAYWVLALSCQSWSNPISAFRNVHDGYHNQM